MGRIVKLVKRDNLTNGHIVVFDCKVKLLLLEVDVAHVDSETRRLGVLLVLENDRVAVDCLGVQAVRVVHVRQVVEHVERQVDVHLVQTARLLPQRPNLLFLRGRLFGLLESLVVVFVDFGGG